MKKSCQISIVVVSALVISLSCNHKQKAPIAITESNVESYIWHGVWDTTINDLVFQKGELYSSFKQDYQALIEVLNHKKYIDIEYLSTNHDTIQIQVNNSEVLTEQLGTFGAEEYIATVVINLTELDGINSVYLEFDEGSHAMPGTYKRENFKNWIKK